MFIGLGLGLTQHRGGGGAPAPSAPVPANYDVLFFGDSRTSDGIGSATSLTNGYAPLTQNLGVAGWIGALSGNRLRVGRYANFGIPASTTTQGAAVPRLDAVNVASAGRWDRPGSSSDFAGNKGAPDAAAHQAGIAVLLYGTNDGSGISTTTESNLVTIMNGIGSGKVIILLNELPRGVDFLGAVTNEASNPAERYALSRELLKYDYASGDAKARANVIVVNAYDAFLDGASGTNYYPIRGVYRDGLHVTPYGGRLLTQTIIDRLAAVWPGWAALPEQVTLPTVNGLSDPAATQPFVHSNPILTPGTNGQSLGTWAVAPAAASIPQGWAVNALSGASGLTGVATKGVDTDPDGYPAFKLEITGTLGANSGSTIQVYQALQSTALSSALSAGRLSINDKLRGVANIKVAAGSQYLVGVGMDVIAQDSTANRTQTVRSNAGTTGGPGLGTALNSYLDAYAASDWTRIQTELIDLQDPNLVAIGQNVAALSALTGRVQLVFRNNSGSTQNVSATVWISRAGVWRVA